MLVMSRLTFYRSETEHRISSLAVYATHCVAECIIKISQLITTNKIIISRAYSTVRSRIAEKKLLLKF